MATHFTLALALISSMLAAGAFAYYWFSIHCMAKRTSSLPLGISSFSLILA
jgi:hypothetical protein